ncbi:hypothetical protein F511_42436 [Dorcoceras hygrometricum]|uniref:Uncharacterized protein n=1 Tax=Dorcoceras hygrometricum TaxID=472368 RepID=A0A2Z7BMS5_9LAMI|nr:hypothetical protein F511_42436 [Dorcoceras hygrometricum]
MKSQQWISSFGPGPDGPPPPPLLEHAAGAAADRRRKIVSGQFDEENPFVLISSALLVQPDEGVSDLVVDRIGDNLPQSIEKSRILVIPVGARHKCQQDLESIGNQNSWNWPPAAAACGGPLDLRTSARGAMRVEERPRSSGASAVLVARLGRAHRATQPRSSRASAALIAHLRRACRARRAATCCSYAHWLHDVEEGGAAVLARWSGRSAARRRTMAHVGARLRRTCCGRSRSLAPCDFDGGALRRPVAAPAMS